jgi:hypothetical protein
MWQKLVLPAINQEFDRKQATGGKDGRSGRRDRVLAG